MMLVVFGAGASHDSLAWMPPSVGHQWRPPLANGLFDATYIEALARFPRLHPILPLLRPPADQPGTSVAVEEVLEALQDEATSYRERLRQLAAVRYYLHYLLWECVNHWASPDQGSNYLTLLDEIERLRKPGATVALVTFNYDILLDRAVERMGLPHPDVDSFIGNDRFPIFKLHGSVDWARPISSPALPRVENMNPWQVVEELINRGDEVVVGDEFVRVTERPIAIEAGSPPTALFPALSIPFVRKANFECPAWHLEQLTKLVRQVDRILVVGWRATDKPFCDLLAKNLPGPVRVMVAAGAQAGAEETVGGLRAHGVPVDTFATLPVGFSAAVGRRLFTPFLAG